VRLSVASCLILLTMSLGAEVDPTGSSVSSAEAHELVEYHNRVRAEVGVPPVRWSPEVAAYAQQWADHLAERGDLEHRSNNRYGENLAIHRTVLQGAASWYAEKRDYRAGTPIPADFGNFEAGHYTQMVWRGTDQIGCGKALVKKGRFRGSYIVVCNYDPPGNYVNEKPY
jgi:pathogenesis-related protein 1